MNGSTLTLTELPGGQRVFEQKYGGRGRIALSRDGTILALRIEEKLHLIDARSGRCLRTVPLTGKGPVCLGESLIATGNDKGGRLELMHIPRFGYRAGWELSRIRSTSQRTLLDERFRSVLDSAQEVYQRGAFREAAAELERARAVEGMRYDPRALALLRRIGAHGRKTVLHGAKLIRSVDVPDITVCFPPGAGWLQIGRGSETRCMFPETGRTLSLPEAEAEADAAYRQRKEQRTALYQRWENTRRSSPIFSADGRYVAFRDPITLLVYDAFSGEKVYTSEMEKYNYITALYGAGLNFRIVSALVQSCEDPADKDRQELLLAVHDLAGGREVHRLHVPVGKTVDTPRDLQISPDGSTALLELNLKESIENQYIQVNLETGKKAPALRKKPAQRYLGLSNCVRYTGIGRQLMYLRDDETVVLTQPEKAGTELEIRENFNKLYNLAISPDAEWLAVTDRIHIFGAGEGRVFLYRLDWEYAL